MFMDLVDHIPYLVVIGCDFADFTFEASFNLLGRFD